MVALEFILEWVYSQALVAVKLEITVLMRRIIFLEAIIIIIFIVIDLVLSHILEIVLRLCGTSKFAGSHL